MLRRIAKLLCLPLLAALETLAAANIKEISHAEISPDGFKESVITWESQISLNYLLRINENCPRAAGGVAVDAGKHEIVIQARDLKPGKNEIRICLDERGAFNEIMTAIYREDSPPPAVSAMPEPQDWNGSDAILLNCTGCSGIYYKTESEKKYSGPIALPADGAKLSFYGLSAAGVRSVVQMFTYEPSEASKPWKNARANLSPLVTSTLGGMRDVLPSGYGAMLSYEQGPDAMLSLARAWYIPGLKAETGFVYLSKSGSTELLVPLNAGPLWEVAPFRRHAGRFFVAGMLGVAYISATAGSFSKSVVTTDAQLLGGYRLPWDVFALRIAARYSAYFDKSITLSGLGAELGFEYILF